MPATVSGIILRSRNVQRIFYESITQNHSSGDGLKRASGDDKRRFQNYSVSHLFLFSTMLFTKWITPIFTLLSGLTLLVILYMINKTIDEDIYIQQHSPVIRMPIIQRLKGHGTIKSPNKIYVYHSGKKYVIDCSNPIFRKTAGVGSITVHYDSVRDKVVLPDIQIKRHYFIQILVLLGGLTITGKSVVDMRQLWLEKPDS